MLQLPTFIALCGNPKSGKSTAAEILEENFGVLPVDDGLWIRKYVMENLGATSEQVYTQAGKASLAYYKNGDPVIDDRTGEHMTWRLVLGRVGKQAEALFGKDFTPRVGVQNLWTGNGESYSIGSCRMSQGAFYKAQGGIVVEIHNPQAQPTGNDFDTYDEGLVDYIIINDGLARGLSPVEARMDLAHKLGAMLVEYSFHKAQAGKQ